MPAVLLGQKKQGAEEGEEEVTPTEDLMREHGLLQRILLIYDEVDAILAILCNAGKRTVSSLASCGAYIRTN